MDDADRTTEREAFEQQLCDLDRYQLCRRLPECETVGHVRRGERRVCRVLGCQAMTWGPA